MTKEIWVGLAELRMSPVEDTSVRFRGKAAFTWWACSATDASTFEARVTEACGEYGLFIAEFENVMAYKEAEKAGLVGDELAELAERAAQDENFCIFGTLHNYSGEN